MRNSVQKITKKSDLTWHETTHLYYWYYGDKGFIVCKLRLMAHKHICITYFCSWHKTGIIYRQLTYWIGHRLSWMKCEVDQSFSLFQSEISVKSIGNWPINTFPWAFFLFHLWPHSHKQSSFKLFSCFSQPYENSKR